MSENNINQNRDFIPPPPTDNEIQSKNKYISPRKKRDVFILALFLGCYGVHDFYTGNTKKGIWKIALSLSIILSPISGILVLIDLVKIYTNDYTDGQGRRLQ